MNLYDLPELYDEQYLRYRDDLGFYLRLAEDYGGPVLELGAGTGRVTAALARAGAEVVGVELSAKMLEKARARLAEANLLERVTLKQGDMRDMRLEQTFPVIIAPFNTLMHAYTLADQDVTLQTVRHHLAPGGVFACDLYAPNFTGLDRLRQVREWAHVGGERTELFLYQTRDADAQLITSRYYLDTVRADGSLTRQTATLTQRYYTRFELERALYQAGFTSLKIYGGFGRERFSHQSPYLVVTATV